MAELTISNIRVSEERENSYLAESTNKLLAGNSPFINGETIDLTGYYVAQTAFDGKVKANAPYKLVFTTSVGDIPFAMLTRYKYDADGEPVEPNGTFNQRVREMLASRQFTTIKDFADAICAKVKKLTVKRKGYRAEGQYGVYTAVIVEFDIAEEVVTQPQA